MRSWVEGDYKVINSADAAKGGGRGYMERDRFDVNSCVGQGLSEAGSRSCLFSGHIRIIGICPGECCVWVNI